MPPRPGSFEKIRPRTTSYSLVIPEELLPIRGGRHKTNWELSAARSFSVIRFFLKKGLKPERFSARGYGEYRPVADNSTTTGRSKNRRIEIAIVRGRMR